MRVYFPWLRELPVKSPPQLDSGNHFSTGFQFFFFTCIQYWTHPQRIHPIQFLDWEHMKNLAESESFQPRWWRIHRMLPESRINPLVTNFYPDQIHKFPSEDDQKLLRGVKVVNAASLKLSSFILIFSLNPHPWNIIFSPNAFQPASISLPKELHRESFLSVSFFF